MPFEIVGEITQIETIAAGKGIRELQRLRRLYGRGRWRKLKAVALVRVRSGVIRKAELHWYEAMGLAGRKSSASTTSTRTRKPRPRSGSRFAVCVENSAYPASLELQKIYRVLPDEDAAREGDLRIVDESGEDYLYPAEWFAAVDLPRRVKTSLLRQLARLQSA
jgi:hypothetical protein